MDRQYTFGRTTRAQVLLPDIRVSRCHGMLEVHDSAWTFTDIGSVNGSFMFRVEDFVASESKGLDLPCIRLDRGHQGRLRPGDGVLLGCRDTWIEMLEEPPPGALPTLAGVNPPSVLAVLGIEAVREGETPDLEWTSENVDLPALRHIEDLLEF